MQRLNGFSGPGRAGKDNVGGGVDEVHFEQVFDLYAIDSGRPVPIPSSHGVDDREAGVLDAALAEARLLETDDIDRGPAT